MELVISLDHLGEGLVWEPCALCRSLEIVPDAPVWEGLEVCAWCPPANCHGPHVSSGSWHVWSNLYGHDSLMYLLDFALASLGREVRLSQDIRVLDKCSEVKFLLCHWLLVLLWPNHAKHGLAALLITQVIFNPQNMSYNVNGSGSIQCFQRSAAFVLLHRYTPKSTGGVFKCWLGLVGGGGCLCWTFLIKNLSDLLACGQTVWLRLLL